MVIFRHIAVNDAGQVTRGTLQTSSRDEAIRVLASRGLTPISIKRDVLSVGHIDFSGRGQKELLTLYDQLATLLNSGIPLAESLAVLADRPGRMGVLAKQVLNTVRQGSTLVEALETSAHAPTSQTLALIKIGEETGSLGKQLELISDNLKRAKAFENEMISGLIYPIVLACLLTGTIFFLAHFILPQFETIFDQGDANLPAETRIVLALGSFVRDWGWTLPGFLALCYFAGKAASRFAPQETARAIHAIPFTGKIAREADLARFCRGLGTLLESNTSMATALPLATTSIINSALRGDIERYTDRIRLGESVQSALGHLFPADARALLDVGERTGQLGSLSLRTATLLETRLADKLKTLAGLIGPSLTILMGGMVAFVIAGVMMGVLGLNDLVQ